MLPGDRATNLFTATVLGLLALAPKIYADERFDHRGAIGLLLGTGVDFKDSIPARQFERDQGLRHNVDLGGTWAIGHDGNEIRGWGRGSFGARNKDWAVAAGYRGYFGQDRVKTFFDLDAVLHLTPIFTAGPRVGIGIQYEITSIWGVFVATGVQIGVGAGLRFSFDAMAGMQIRTYLLE